MGSDPVKTERVREGRSRVSRRAVLRAGVGGALTLAAGGVPSAKTQTTPRFPWLTGETARVIDVRSGRITRTALVDRAIVADMISQGITALTRQPDLVTGWKQILGGAKRLAVKFNSVAADVIGTNETVAAVLLDQLISAGADPAQLMFVEAPANFASRYSLGVAPQGWGESIRIGEATEQLANWLLQADAVISVGLLKTHQIAGMSGCLKNISHAVVRHPARFHDDHCSPAVPLIFSNARIAPKVRLNLLNAVRCVIDRGPDAVEGDIAWYGGLLLGFDPVATDVIGRAVLEEERRRRGLPQRVDVPYLKAAADLGLGRYRLVEIERVPIERDS